MENDAEELRMEVRALPRNHSSDASAEPGFQYLGREFRVGDFVFLEPSCVFKPSGSGGGRSATSTKGGRNIGLHAWVVGQIEKFYCTEDGGEKGVGRGGRGGKGGDVVTAPSRMSVRRFFRPEDVSGEGEDRAYRAHVREVYYSDVFADVDVSDVVGKCQVRREKPPPVATSAWGASGAAGFGYGLGGCAEEELWGTDFVFFCDRYYDKGAVKLVSGQ